MSYDDSIFKVEKNSDIVRVYANAIVQVYETQTMTLVFEGQADANGFISISPLETGIYDVKVDGNLVKTIDYVDASASRDREIEFFIGGQINGDLNHANTRSVITLPNVGKIIKAEIILIESDDATTDLTVHLLQGLSTKHDTLLTFASDSVWDYRINPNESGSYFYFEYTDDTLDIDVAINDIIAIGVDYVLGGAYGLKCIFTYRPIY